MTRLILTLLGVLGCTAAASAQPVFPQQPQSPLPKPTISPYLNLLRNNVPPALNYYGLVKPQQDARNALNNLQSQINGLQNASANAVYGGTGNELSTGKQVGYFTHRAYFMNMNGNGFTYPTGGQFSTAGSNALFRPQQQQQIPGHNSIMPFNR